MLSTANPQPPLPSSAPLAADAQRSGDSDDDRRASHDVADTLKLLVSQPRALTRFPMLRAEWG